MATFWILSIFLCLFMAGLTISEELFGWPKEENDDGRI